MNISIFNNITPVHIEQTCSLSREAEIYLEEALDFIQQNSVKRDEVDWDDLRRRAFLCAKGAGTPSDTHQAIRLVLFMLEDRHSMFWVPERIEEWYQDVHPEEVNWIQEKSHLIDNEIGYLLIPRFPSANPEAVSRYASNLQKAIAELDKSGIDKWILDLRGNSGGNGGAMMMGLAPFFSLSEILDAFGANPRNLEGMSYDGKTVQFQEGSNIYSCSLDMEPYHLKNPHPQIALLLDGQTGSAGEQTALAFIGIENVKSFGKNTGGVTTWHISYALPDDAIILLAYSYMKDRQGNVYKSGITPDEYISDDALLAAKKWLHAVSCT